MSWNAYVSCASCGHSLVDANYTYNVSPMFYDVFDDEGGLRSLDGMPAAEALPILELAVERLRADPKKYQAMNPSNGWGNYAGATLFLESLAVGCRENPEATVSIH